MRLVGLAVAVVLGVCVVLYIATGERRYLRLAGRIFTVALVVVVLFLLLLFGERLVNVL
jgi:threonine/homoserine efflux transporter RhtA